MLQRVLLATFQYALIMPLRKPWPAAFHFDPFGTEFREPGRISHPLQRSFQLAPEFLATTRQSRFHRSHAYVERGGDLFVGKAFDVS